MELVDIGGRRLATWCTGDGDPPVILETGLGAPASDWATVHEGVASATRVCHYDRANCGDSDPAGTPRTARDMAEDLHALMEALGLGPVVLVGHSFGALVSLSYSARWPDEVAGLVLVDPTHPEQFTHYGPVLPDFLGEMKEFWTTGWLTPEGTAERIDFHRTFEEIRNIRTLDDLRMIVLTSGNWRMFGAGDPQPHEQWVRFHQDYLALTSRGEQRVVQEADHFIQRTAPEAVIEAITDVVAEIRS